MILEPNVTSIPNSSIYTQRLPKGQRGSPYLHSFLNILIES